MVTSIARQSVILKCLRKKSVLLGNYEFYYLAGLMNRIFGTKYTGSTKPEELSAQILAEIDSLKASNEEEAYLLHLVKYYLPLDQYDSQMQYLFSWGENEKDLWQVNTSNQPPED